LNVFVHCVQGTPPRSSSSSKCLEEAQLKRVRTSAILSNQIKF